MRAPLPIRLMPDRPVVGLATLWGLGDLGRAPGTLGTIAGALWYTVMAPHFGWLGFLIFSVALVPVAVWFCGEAEWRMHRHDPGCIILDEFVAVPFCFTGIGTFEPGMRSWMVILIGFALFRLFDITKPPPIRQLQRLPGGLGVVVDDLAAALLANIGLVLLVSWKPGWFHMAG